MMQFSIYAEEKMIRKHNRVHEKIIIRSLYIDYGFIIMKKSKPFGLINRDMIQI